MLLNKNFSGLLFALSICWTQPSVATEICPIRDEQPLRFAEIFDGNPEDLAALIPDSAKARSGYWDLNYIYDAGRFATVRCKYFDGQTLDLRILNRIQRCDYKINAKKVLKLNCE